MCLNGINIIYANGSWELSHSDVIPNRELFIHELTCSAAIEKRFLIIHASSIFGTQSNVYHQLFFFFFFFWVDNLYTAVSKYMCGLASRYQLIQKKGKKKRWTG